MFITKIIIIIFIKFTVIILLCIYNIIFIFNKKMINNYYLNSKINKNNILRKINEYAINCKKKKIINKIENIFVQPNITSTVILYNAEKTISTAVRSIQNQNMKNIEILLVDDNSLDNSLKIILKLKEEDSRIKIIKNKINRGSIFSRSIATLYAKGKYIMALDSDDIFINKNIFELCYKDAENQNIDIIEFSGFMVRKFIQRLNQKFPKIAFYLRYKNNNTIIRKPKLFNYLYNKNKTHIIRLMDGYIWGKCIRTYTYKSALKILGEDIYKQNINFGEDRIVNFILFKVANSFKFIEEYGIIYIYNPLSIFHSYHKESILHDELINLNNIYKFTNNSTDVKIVAYEINYRWEKIIKVGLNEENKKNIIILINLLLANKYLDLNDKNKLQNYLELIINNKYNL
jgi:glycosyltransferase involved in cell wall biosynthesis